MELSKTQILEKFASLKEGPDKVVFGYRYVRQKIENYISITNLRLEILQIKEGKVMLTSAVPVLDISHNKGTVAFCDKDVCFITSGPRTNIIARTKYLKEGEEATPVSFCYAEELTEDSQFDYLKRAVMFNSAEVYPGIDMREPEMFRCSKNPERFRLNFNTQLADLLGVSDTEFKNANLLKEKFLQKIDTLACKTQEGYVVPFDWIYAGGMVIADASFMGKLKPSAFFIRSNTFLSHWVVAKGWNITVI